MESADIASLDALRTAAKDCTRCPLYEPATQTVFGEGPADAWLMLLVTDSGVVEIGRLMVPLPSSVMALPRPRSEDTVGSAAQAGGGRWEFRATENQPLDVSGQEPWMDCPAEGPLDFVVTPAYVANNRIYRKQQVGTRHAQV